MTSKLSVKYHSSKPAKGNHHSAGSVDEFEDVKIFTDMLQLWDVHVSLTREVIIADVLKTANLDTSVLALFANQQALGENLAQCYGKKKGDRYTELLNIHIAQAIEIVNAILGGLDPSSIITAWYENGKEIAKFLTCTIKGIRYEKMFDLIDQHLDCTLDEAGMIIAQDWAGSQTEYQLCLARVKEMSNYIAEHVARQCEEHCNAVCK